MVGRKVLPQPASSAAQITVARAANTARLIEIIPSPPALPGSLHKTVTESLLYYSGAAHGTPRCRLRRIRRPPRRTTPSKERAVKEILQKLFGKIKSQVKLPASPAFF